MTFDLYAFPPSGPRTVPEVHQLMEAEEQRLASGTDGPRPQPGPEMAAFLEELENGWPSLMADDPDESPWSSWPLWQPVGCGTALNIAWSRAEEMYAAILEIAARVNVAIYDPQADEVITPPG